MDSWSQGPKNSRSSPARPPPGDTAENLNLHLGLGRTFSQELRVVAVPLEQVHYCQSQCQWPYTFPFGVPTARGHLQQGGTQSPPPDFPVSLA